MCYYKKNDIPNAITYLTIATYNSSKENGKRKIDHSKLISELLNRKVSLSHNHENIFSNKEYSMHKKFVGNETYNYNIPDVEGIFSYARENHMDIEQVGEKLDLTTPEGRDTKTYILQMIGGDATPFVISIYTRDFDSKERIIAYFDKKHPENIEFNIHENLDTIYDICLEIYEEE